MAKLNLITRQNAPMQLADFMNIPEGDCWDDRPLYRYSIRKENGRLQCQLEESGARFTLLTEAVVKARSLDPRTKGLGLYLEFGFGSGKTINFIAALADNSLVYGFDSGNGIGKDPHVSKRPYAYTKTIDWKNVKNGKSERLDKAGENLIPEDVETFIPLIERISETDSPFIPFTPLCNVVLYTGEIPDTLPAFIKSRTWNQGEYISFLLIDIDNAALSDDIMSILYDHIDPDKTIILSDHPLSTEPLKRLEPGIREEIVLSAFTQDNVDLQLSRFIQTPPTSPSRAAGENTTMPTPGNNVLHFNSRNRSNELYKDPSMAPLLARLKTDSVTCLKSDSAIIKYSIDKARSLWQTETEAGKPLYFLEFGFCSGRSANFISCLLGDNEKLFGFDSGKGLPHHWRFKFPKGEFRYTKTLKKENGVYAFEHIPFSVNSTPLPKDKTMFIPFIPNENITLVIGLIEDTLGAFIDDLVRKEPDLSLGMIFIDTDLYSAANEILNRLEPYIKPEKTIVLFDEFFNFEGTPSEDSSEGKNEWQFHEYKALEDFGKRRDGYRYLAYNENGQQVAIVFNSPLD